MHRSRNSWVNATLVLALALVISPVAFEQAAAPTAASRARTTPDLTGIWLGHDAGQSAVHAAPMQPWAEAKFKSAKPGDGPRASAGAQDPILSCLPPGVPRIMLMSSFPVQIVQVPGEVMMVFEYDHFVRQIDTTRREHPKDVSHTWMGDSIGHWEGDTLVVDTVGFNDKTWLDEEGHPHTDALHVIERIRRTDHDTLEDDITIDDPKAYTKPWARQQIFRLMPGWHLDEHICEDTMPDWYK